VTNRDDILSTALERFAHQGIAATSVQDIADHSSSSKANVLYHFTSKEQLVDSALHSALGDLEEMVAGAEKTGLSLPTDRSGFINNFVDFLLAHRMAVQIIVTHPYLVDSIPALRSAQELMSRLATLLAEHTADESELLLFGIAVSGATYALVSGGILGFDPMDTTELRPLLREFLANTLHLEPTTSEVMT